MDRFEQTATAIETGFDHYTEPRNCHLHLVEQSSTQILARFSHLGKIEIINTKKPLQDYAGQPLPCNFKLETDNPHEAAKLALELNLGIVFIGALTSATNNFGEKKQPAGLRGVIAIKPKGLTTLASTNPQEAIENKSDQVVINRDKNTVTVGAGLTYAQVNKIVAEELGAEYWVAVDLTSIEEALAGAVFATGGQGPSGIKLSEIAVRVNQTNGREIQTLTTKQELEDHEGLAGLQGGVTELELKILKRPPRRFGLRVILKGTAGHQDYSPKAAALLAKIAPFFKLKFANGTLSSEAGTDFIDGLEIMDRASIAVVNRARKDYLSNAILHEMDNANSDYCVYLTANSTQTLEQLCDSADDNLLLALAELEEIADITVVEGIERLEDMRLIRENIPDIAKRQVTHSKVKPFSTSLDFNFGIDKNAELNPLQLQEIYHEILRAFYDYEKQVMTYVGTIAEAKNTNITMFRYGHLGRDPHTRFTIWPNETNTRPDDVQDVGATISVLKKRLLSTLKELQEKHPEIQIHAGEKGKTPDPSVLSAEVLARSQAIIATADKNWNFRAPKAFKN
ncbi:FAD-binding oxidoreductase [Candidatus Peregrinibacteria bacterium]|nr:FAD-binding oxidoreductase [Candidatus Peregrinibacteria bacterium]